jgi:hypothetical protein
MTESPFRADETAAGPNMLAAALNYAGAGIGVFPVNGKAPLTERGFHDASTDREQIEAWWSDWPTAGIATPDYDVVDVDLYKPECAATWTRIRPLIPAGTPHNKTGGGGLQFFFKAGTLTDGKIGPGVDSRYAGRNYVLLPPSPHPDGGRYEAVVDVLRKNPTAAPDFPRESGSSSEFGHLVKQMDNGEKITDGRNKAAWWRAVEILRTLPANTDLEPVRALIQSWVNTNCAGELDEVDVPKQVKGAAKFVAAERNGEPAIPDHDAQLAEVAADVATKAGTTPTLQDVLTTVRNYLQLDAGEAVTFAVILAVAVARELTDEEPLWLMLVTASGGTKSEAIRLCKLAADGRVDELTRAGLLSWSNVGKKVRRTGLLTVIPPVAFVTISDFSTVITTGDRDARARMFGALRVVYDGRLYRSIGGQPATDGDALEWEGHLTLLAGATPAVDTHFSFEAAMGERWLIYRPDEVELARARKHTRYAVNREDVPPLREHAQKLAAALIHHARERVPAHLSDESKDTLTDAATLIAQVRTGVEFEGTGRYRTVIGYPMPELPMRLGMQLHRLARCLVALGIDERIAVRIAVKTAGDSVPVARWKAFRHVAEGEAVTVSSTWRAIGRGNRWGAKWQLTALEAIGLVDVDGPDEDTEPNAVRIYRLEPALADLYESVASFFTPLSIRGE